MRREARHVSGRHVGRGWAEKRGCVLCLMGAATTLCETCTFMTQISCRISIHDAEKTIITTNCNPKNRLEAYECVCVLRIEPFFLPVDIQHNKSPCRFFNPRVIHVKWPQKLRHRCTTLLRTRYVVSTVNNVMACYHTGYDRYDIHMPKNRDNKREKTESK